MDGLWDAEQLDEALTRVLAANADQALDDAGSWRLRIRVTLALLRTRLTWWENVQRHRSELLAAGAPITTPLHSRSRPSVAGG